MAPDSLLELSIVIPCLNEAGTLSLCLKKAQGFLEKEGLSGEIIVADNGSTDDSIRIARAHGVRVVSVDERGYGAALAGGIQAASGVYVIMGDADDSYDFSALQPILGKLREGNDLVMGNRFKGEIKKGAMPFLNRYLGNPVLSWLGRLFFGISLGDFHCGLRGFNRQKILDLELRTTGMEYASEMIVRASLHDLKMAEVPVTLWPDGRGHPPHMRPWRDGWRHLRFLLLYSPRWLYWYPGIAMILFGVILSILLLPGPVMIADGVGLDVHTLLIASMSTLVGVQSMTFGILARSFAMKNGIIPSNPKHEKWIEGITLEKLLVLACLLIFMGLGAVFWAAERWSSVDFGALNYRDVMRILIFAVTTIVGGIQLGFAAFLLGILQIRHK